MSVIKNEDKLGIRSAHSAQMAYDNYRIHKSRVLGGEGMGFKIALTILNAGRIGIAAQAVGIAQGAYEAARDYAKVREQFGQPIARFQAVGFTLADMATRIKAARLLTYDAADRKDRHEDYIAAASMAKLFATETAQRAVDVAVQVHGARALEQGHLLEHLYREVRAPRIYEGASEVQREIIARELYKEAE